MRPLTASEAINPAMERARDVLGRPFRWGTFLKMAAVAFFAEIGGGINLNFPSRSGGLHGAAPAVRAFIVAFAVIFALVFLIVGIALFYVGSRLQFVLLEIVATRQTYVSPLWRKYGQPTWRWMGLKLLFFLIMVVLMLLLAAPIVLYFFFALHRRGIGAIAGGFSGLHLFAILLLVVAAFLFLMVLSAAYMLLRDFALPFIAFEDVSISEALRRLRSLIVAEPGQIVVFLLLRLLLIFVLAIAGEIAVALIFLVSLVPFGLLGGILWFILHHAGTGGTILLIAAAVFGGLLFISWMVCVGIAILGSVYTFSQAYALYFLGGRYPLLGEMLDRSTPPPYPYSHAMAQPPPYFPPPSNS